MKKVFVISAILLSACIAYAQQNLTPTQKFYQLSQPVKAFHEWEISTDELAGNFQFDTNNYKIIEEALDNGELDEMSTSIITYQFSPDGKEANWIEEYSDQTPSKVRIAGMPGIFYVEFVGGLPVSFKLDEADFNRRVDEGLIFMDAYDNGLNDFVIKYDNNNLPKSLVGHTMEYFGGKEYAESYSNYKFDKNGNWISRIIESPYDTKKQFRSYEY